MRIHFAGALLVSTLAATAHARPWRGIEPGVSTKENVLAALGEPTKVLTSGSKQICGYVSPAGLRGVAQVQFHLDAQTLKVERIDVFPRSVVDVDAVEGTYGQNCGRPRAWPAPGCYVKKLAKDGRPFLDYPTLGIAVFLKEDGQRVESLAFLPSKGGAPSGGGLAGIEGEAPPRTDRTDKSRPPPADPTAGWPGDAGSSGGATSGSADASASGESDDWGGASAFAPVTGSKPPPASDRFTEFGGKVTVGSFAQLSPPVAGKVHGRAAVEGVFEGKVKAGRTVGYAALLARRDFIDGSRDRMDVHEAYGELSRPHLKVTAGRLITPWGAASLLNPSDVLNPVDRTDFILTEKRGSWMVRGSVVLESIALEAYYLPIPEPHILPVIDGIADDGRLLSTSPWVVGGVPQDPSLPLRYTLRNVGPPAPTLANGQAAARLALSFLGTDVRLGYGYLLDKFPLPRTTTDTTTLPSYVGVTVDFEYPRLHVVTFDVERPFGPLRVAAEAAWTRYVRPLPQDVERSFVTYVAGFDYQLPTFGNDQKIHLFLEWTQTLATEGELLQDFIGQLRHPFTRAVLARVSYQAGSSFTAELSGVAMVTQPDFLVRAQAAFSVADGVKLKLGATGFGGASTGFFGRYARNRRVEAAIEAGF